jgi:hypothetical protein
MDPDLNYGSSTNALVGTNGSFPYRYITQFDLTTLPKNINITAASISLYFYQSSTTNTLDIDMHSMSPTQWSEMGATWNSANEKESWLSPGGDYIATTLSTTNIPSSAPAGFYKFSVPAGTLMDMINGNVDDNGFIFKAKNEPGDNNVFYLYTHEAYLEQFMPRLDITFTAAAGFTDPELFKPIGGEIIDQSFPVHWRHGAHGSLADPLQVQYIVDYSYEGGAWTNITTTSPGINYLDWDASGLAAGNYEIRVSAKHRSYGTMGYSQ